MEIRENISKSNAKALIKKKGYTNKKWKSEKILVNPMRSIDKKEGVY